MAKTHYIVITNMPGYMPDGDNSYTSNLRHAEAIAAERAKEFRDEGDMVYENANKSGMVRGRWQSEWEISGSAKDRRYDITRRGSHYGTSYVIEIATETCSGLPDCEFCEAEHENA